MRINTQKGMNINYNQVGYKTNGIKRAVFAGDDIKDGFSIVNAQDGKVVFGGSLSKSEYYEDGKENVRIADFSSFSETGKYYILAEDGSKTAEFSVGDDVYKEALDLSKRFFFLHRCGCELSKEDGGAFAHKACHNTLARIHNTDKFIDVNGGWHDAGDYGRYIVAAAKAVVDLLMTYEFFVGKSLCEKCGKALLDEVKYEIDWMLKMQDCESGGVYHKVTCASFPPMVVPEEETEELIVSPISNTATYDFAAIMAYAYRVYGQLPEYKDYADKCLEAGKKALEFMENVGAPLFKNPEGIVTGEYGDTCELDEKFWAYAEMYKTTGDKKYEDMIISMNLDEVPGMLEWKEIGEYGFYAYVTAENHSDDEFYKAVYKRLTDHVDSIVESVDKDVYGYSMSGHYYWGCNMGVADDAMLLIMMDRLEGTDKYKDYVESLVSYLFGNNPNSICYLTGVGSNPAKHPHHRPSAAVNRPMPGMLVGGPEPRILDEYMKSNNFEGVAKAKCYADDTGSYSTNEITIYWNSPLVFVLQSLVK